jgi:hypothetical protein
MAPVRSKEHRVTEIKPSWLGDDPAVRIAFAELASALAATSETATTAICRAIRQALFDASYRGFMAVAPVGTSGSVLQLQLRPAAALVLREVARLARSADLHDDELCAAVDSVIAAAGFSEMPLHAA